MIITAELTYNEPVAKATFLQFRYKFQYKYSESDRSTYSLLPMLIKDKTGFGIMVMDYLKVTKAIRI